MKNPIKLSFKSEWFSVLLLLIIFISSFYFYLHFPDQVPSHWNIRGEVDGYSSRLGASILIPLMTLGMYLMFLFLPYLDPKKEQYAKFTPTYHFFKNAIVAFFFILYFLTGLNGLGYKMDIGFYVPIMIGILFIVIGFMMKRLKTNWFMGIRTPWTMSSEVVWEKTSRFGSYLFTLSGILMAATVLFKDKGKIILFVLAIFLIALVIPAASYFFYYQEAKKAQKNEK